jgi:hypothetical protein
VDLVGFDPFEVLDRLGHQLATSSPRSGRLLFGVGQDSYMLVHGCGSRPHHRRVTGRSFVCGVGDPVIFGVRRRDVAVGSSAVKPSGGR